MPAAAGADVLTAGAAREGRAADEVGQVVGVAVGGLTCAWADAGGEERAGIGEGMRGGSMVV